MLISPSRLLGVAQLVGRAFGTLAEAAVRARQVAVLMGKVVPRLIHRLSGR